MVYGLSKIPIIGEVVSLLVSIFWPSPTQNVWEQVRAEVEKLVDQKLSELVFDQTKSKLNGAGQALKEYLNSVASGSNPYIMQHFTACKVFFAGAGPEFQISSYEWVQAPLYALFAQLHMSLLRDGALHGKDWGFDAAAHASIVSDFAQWEEKYNQDLLGVVSRERQRLQSGAPTSLDGHRTNIYNYWQAFEEQSTMLIDDYRLLLHAYKMPQSHVVPFKDIYSRAYGTADNWDTVAQSMSGGTGAVGGPYSKPLSNFTSIYIERFNFGPRIVDVRHPANKGPQVREGARVDEYGIIASRKTGVETNTVTFPASTTTKMFHVERAQVRAGSIPLTVNLYLDTGVEKPMWHNHTVPGGTTYNVAVSGRMLSTLNMWTHSTFYSNNLGCIIFGFSRDPIYIPPTVRHAIYVGTIGEPDTEIEPAPDAALRARRDAYRRSIEEASK